MTRKPDTVRAGMSRVRARRTKAELKWVQTPFLSSKRNHSTGSVVLGAGSYSSSYSYAVFR